jgi:hypothetical protein
MKILAITPSSITAQVFPLFAFKNSELNKEVTVSIGERATVGPYSTTLLESTGETARISMCTIDYAWEQTLKNEIEPQIGNITIQDLIGWSRLHTYDLDGLRPMCEDQNTFEAAMIFKIPNEHATLLSSGWFAANHACSSIYIPVHICDTDFYDSYETGDAAALSLSLLQKYGHGNITSLCQSVESVFLLENEINEAVAHLMIHADLNITSFLTELDKGMQEQAYLTEQLWLSVPNASRTIIEGIWTDNYATTQELIRNAQASFSNNPNSDTLRGILGKITQSISDSSKTRQKMHSLLFMMSSSVQYNE